MNLPAHATQNAALVVAHPDDELLWFGSVVDRMSRIFIVFADHPDEPELGAARRAALRNHPLAERITLLGLTETRAFDAMDWEAPTADPSRPVCGEPEVAAALARARAQLADEMDGLLGGYRNVFTHNPWGLSLSIC